MYCNITLRCGSWCYFETHTGVHHTNNQSGQTRGVREVKVWEVVVGTSRCKGNVMRCDNATSREKQEGVHQQAMQLPVGMSRGGSASRGSGVTRGYASTSQDKQIALSGYCHFHLSPGEREMSWMDDGGEICQRRWLQGEEEDWPRHQRRRVHGVCVLAWCM